jgi:hypothetical protein
MRNKIIFACVLVGVFGAGASAYVYTVPAKTQPPAFDPRAQPVRQRDLRQRHRRELPGPRREHQHLP